MMQLQRNGKTYQTLSQKCCVCCICKSFNFKVERKRGSKYIVEIRETEIPWWRHIKGTGKPRFTVNFIFSATYYPVPKKFSNICICMIPSNNHSRFLKYWTGTQLYGSLQIAATAFKLYFCILHLCPEVLTTHTPELIPSILLSCWISTAHIGMQLWNVPEVLLCSAPLEMHAGSVFSNPAPSWHRSIWIGSDQIKHKQYVANF